MLQDANGCYRMLKCPDAALLLLLVAASRGTQPAEEARMRLTPMSTGSYTEEARAPPSIKQNNPPKKPRGCFIETNVMV
ncbi:hypothetical protein EYF80_049900 [Liparis tanakae]|uniref:Secreted protein n=1 Tax=Liparis tanakae TaxID=230148 RepID=A0A4Z2FGQ5_9TELE|nr:hypothetical protein EYF80_049900 [Liparis tanakae]